jgi:hypothetical protein
LIQANRWEGKAKMIDLDKVRHPPEVAPERDRESTFLSKEWRRGYKAHLGDLESDRGIPR